MRRLIRIYDTTLRDGTQGEGVTFSTEDKLRIASRLEATGVHYIEGGWPGSNPKDLRFFRRSFVAGARRFDRIQASARRAPEPEIMVPCAFL